MKNYIVLFMMTFSVVMFAQKKKNGTIYKEHPAIKMVEEMQQAFVKGDTAKVASYLADDFRAFNGMNDDPDNEGMTKKQFVRSSMGWKNNADYLSISRYPGAYPDALEYTDEDNNLWVQTWDKITGVHSTTGVKLDMPLHRLFKINKDNKISSIITYDDGGVWAQMRDAFNTRKNGVLYDQHENINTVRKMVTSLEHGDVEKGFSYFTENATFTNLDMPRGESNSLEQEMEAFKKLNESWDILSIDMVGYPDYLEYERGNVKVVQSWWDFNLKRKSDNKKVSIPVMLINYFNDEGKMTRENGYYTASALQD